MTQRDCMQPTSQSYSGLEVVQIGNAQSYDEAQNIALGEAQRLREEPMLLAWWNGDERTYFPATDCKGDEEPAWMSYAKAHGADLALHSDQERYVFLFKDTKLEGHRKEGRQILGDHMQNARNESGRGMV